MSFGLMLVVLQMTNRRALNRYTGFIAGVLVATFITFEAPISGMSMNPARSFASALPAHYWHGLWIYFTAPVVGMLLAAEVYLRTHGHGAVLCCKIHHENNQRCIFRCRYGEPAIASGAAGGSAFIEPNSRSSGGVRSGIVRILFAAWAPRRSVGAVDAHFPIPQGRGWKSP